MIHVSPQRLAEAREAVKDKHPDTHSGMTNDPEALANSSLGDQLIRRLRGTPEEDLHEFVDELSASERGFISTLILDSDSSIRRKTGYCLLMDPELARPKLLWRAINRFFGNEAGNVSARLLSENNNLNATLNPLQRNIVQNWSEPPETWLTTVWLLAVQELNLNADTMFERINIVAGSALEAALESRFLTKEPRGVWERQNDSYPRELFKNTDVNTKLKTLVHVWQEFGNGGENTRIHDSMRGIVELLRGQPRLLDILENHLQRVAEWYKTLFRRLELEDFFEKSHENERYEFWQGYLPHLKDVEVDREYARLFLEFDHFGVIEFGERNNAAYAYRLEDFKKFRRMNARERPTSNSTLKNRDDAIFTVEHYINWQERTQRDIQKYLV